MRSFLKGVIACTVAVSAEVFVSDSQDDNGVSFNPVNVVEEDIRNLAVTTAASTVATTAAGVTTAATKATAAAVAGNMTGFKNVVYCETPRTPCRVRDALVYALLALFLGSIGADRCFLGNVCFGVVKGVTCGGCGVWAVIDYIIFVYVCITQRGSIDHMGMQANFTPDSLNGAWWVAAIALGLICCSITIQLCVVLGLATAASSIESLASSDDDSS